MAPGGFWQSKFSPAANQRSFPLAGHAGEGYICDRGHVLKTFRVRASMDPAGVAHLAKFASYTEPHPEVKGDSSDLLGPQFY